MRVTIKRMSSGRYRVETNEGYYMVKGFANAKALRSSILKPRKASIINVKGTSPLCMFMRVQRTSNRKAVV